MGRSKAEHGGYASGGGKSYIEDQDKFGWLARLRARQEELVEDELDASAEADGDGFELADASSFEADALRSAELTGERLSVLSKDDEEETTSCYSEELAESSGAARVQQVSW